MVAVAAVLTQVHQEVLLLVVVVLELEELEELTQVALVVAMQLVWLIL